MRKNQTNFIFLHILSQLSHSKLKNKQLMVIRWCICSTRIYQDYSREEIKFDKYMILLHMVAGKWLQSSMNVFFTYVFLCGNFATFPFFNFVLKTMTKKLWSFICPLKKKKNHLIIYPKMENYFLLCNFSKILTLTTVVFGFSVILLLSSFSIYH